MKTRPVVNRSFLLAAFTALTVTAAGAVTFRPGETEVVVAPSAPSFTRFAAEEATNFLSRVLGAPVPIVKAPTAGKASLVLGTNVWAWAAGVDPSPLPRDSYIQKAVSNVVYIAGRDAANFDLYRFFTWKHGYGTLLVDYERATLFGVYGFLEEAAGVRFIFPDDELGTIVPRKAEIVVPDGVRTVTPDFLLRNPYFGGDGRWPFASYGGHDVKTILWLRQRYSTCIIPCCHGSRDFKYIERFGQTHPEYLARKRDGSVRLDPNEFAAYQLCWSNPGFREELYQDVKAYLTGQPATSRGLKNWANNCRYRKYVDIMPDDSFQGCACTNCQAAYRCPEGRDPTKHRCAYATELMWGVAKEVGERLLTEKVDGNITLMSYFPYNKIPSFDLPTNVHVMVAKGGPWTMIRPESCAADMADVRAWAKKLGHKVWIWTYPSKYGTLMVKGVPCVGPHAWGRYYAELQDAIIGGFMECESDEAIYNFLNYYVFSHVMWNAKTDIDALLDEAYGLMFGAGAAEMKDFFGRLERIWTTRIVGPTVDTPLGPVQSRPDDLQLWTAVYTPAVRRALRETIDRAAAKVPASSPEARRIALMRREFMDRLDAEADSYMDGISIEKGLAERATLDPKANIVVNPDCTRPLSSQRFFGYHGTNGQWVAGWHAGNKGDCTIDTNVFVTGHASFRLSGKNVGLSQYLSGSALAPALKPSTRYRLSFFLKFENVVSHGGGLTANIWDDKNVWFPSSSSVPHGRSFTGTSDWIYQSFVFTSGPETNSGKHRSYINFTLLQSEGTFWVDGVRLEEWPEK